MLTPADAGAWSWVLAGSALGGMARYWLSLQAARLLGEDFPWGTLGVNVSGTLAAGLLLGAAGRIDGALTAAALHLLLVGFLGSYTTVSSLSLQTLQLARGGRWLPAAGNVALSATLCISAAWLGLLLAAR